MSFVKEYVRDDITAITELDTALEELKTEVNRNSFTKSTGEKFFSCLRKNGSTLQKVRRKFKDADSAHYRIENSLNSTIINLRTGTGKPIKEVVSEIKLTQKFLGNI